MFTNLLIFAQMMADSSATADTSSHLSALDTTIQAVMDTTGKNDVEKIIISSLTYARENSAEEVLGDLLDVTVKFGFKLLGAILLFVVAVLFVKLIRRAMDRSFRKRKRDKAVVSFIKSFVTALIWVIVIIGIVGLLGFETTSLAALLAAGGVAIGMALGGTVQNFAGGLMILAFKPFKVGDKIEAQGYTGIVRELNLTSTKITTIDNQTIILPNGALSNGVINNHTKEEFRRIDLTIGIEYGNDADKAIELLLQIASDEPKIIQKADGAPEDSFAGVYALAASSVDIILRVWVKTPDYWPTYFSLNKRIYKTLPENGINFPFPQMSVHIEKN